MSQSLSKLYVHLVFSTKGRADLLTTNELPETYAYLSSLFADNHCPAIAIGGTRNHVHCLFILSKTENLSNIVKYLKSNSSRWINRRHNLHEPFAWQDGYGAFSLSVSHVDSVKAYIAGQEKHHRKVSFKDEFRRLCQLYSVEMNEQHAWD